MQQPALSSERDFIWHCHVPMMPSVIKHTEGALSLYPVSVGICCVTALRGRRIAGNWQWLFDRQLEPADRRGVPGGRSGAAAHGLWSSGLAILQGSCTRCLAAIEIGKWG